MALDVESSSRHLMEKREQTYMQGLQEMKEKSKDGTENVLTLMSTLFLLAGSIMGYVAHTMRAARRMRRARGL